MNQNDRKTETEWPDRVKQAHTPTARRSHRSRSNSANVSALTASVMLLVIGAAVAQERPEGKKWAACWASAMQGVYAYLPPVPLNNPYHIYETNPDLRFAFPKATDGAVEQTFRLIVKPDLFGDEYRPRFSNFFGSQPLTLKAVSVAVQDYAGNIIAGTLREVKFNGAASVTIEPGKLTYSDSFKSPADANDPLLQGRNFAVSFAVEGKSGPMTRHIDGLSTSYISPPNSGDHTKDANDFAFPNTTTSVFFLDAMDVMAAADTAVVCAFGDSITDGKFSTINGNDRWSNDLSTRLHEAFGGRVSVVNEGISGNTVLKPPVIGPSALDRLDRDVLGLSGLSAVVWLQGINDFGAGNATANHKRPVAYPASLRRIEFNESNTRIARAPFDLSRVRLS